MSKGPTPHLFTDEGGVVTRCQDVRLARLLLVEASLEIEGYSLDDIVRDSDWREVVVQVSRRFRARDARVGYGRINVARSDDWDGASWYWQDVAPDRRGHGITPAVWWY